MNIQMESILVLLNSIHDFQLKTFNCSVRRVIIPEMVENATPRARKGDELMCVPEARKTNRR
jgi:hypothetical protein